MPSKVGSKETEKKQAGLNKFLPNWITSQSVNNNIGTKLFKEYFKPPSNGVTKAEPEETADPKGNGSVKSFLKPKKPPKEAQALDQIPKVPKEVLAAKLAKKKQGLFKSISQVGSSLIPELKDQ